MFFHEFIPVFPGQDFTITDSIFFPMGPSKGQDVEFISSHALMVAANIAQSTLFWLQTVTAGNVI